MRHPTGRGLAVAALVVLAIPAFGLNTANSGASGLPQGHADREAPSTASRPPSRAARNRPSGDHRRRREGAGPVRARSASCASGSPPTTTSFGAAADRVGEQDGGSPNCSVPLAGDGTDSRSKHALDEAPRPLDPGHGRQCPRRPRPGRRPDRLLGRLQRPAGRADAVGVRLRPRRGVPAAAGQLPLGRHPAHRDRPQPALGRRRLRDRRLDLPGRAPGRPARLRLDRLDHRLAAAVPLRRPLRAVDGLPRVHPHPDPGGVRSRHVDRRGRLARAEDDRGRGHQRGRGDGRRVRDLRDPLLPRLQGDGRGAGGGDPDRRDDRPRGAPAGDDEAARRAQLVPAAGAGLDEAAAAAAPALRRPSRRSAA